MAIARLPRPSVEIIPVPVRSAQTTLPPLSREGLEELFERAATAAQRDVEPEPSRGKKIPAAVQEPAQAGASTVKAGPDSEIVIAAMITVAVALVLIYMNSSTPAQPPTLSGEVGLFALLYIAAQGIERLLEPFASLIYTADQKELERDQKAAAFRNLETKAAGDEAASKQAALDKRRANRTVIFWAASIIVGMGASGWLGIYLLRTIGFTTAPDFVEILLTGLVIGGGTKPLHDLISRIEKAKNNAADPPETRAGSS